MKKTALIALFAVLFGAPPVLAEYPDKPVQFVVPFPPGDAEDILTRHIAEDFQEKYGVPAAVINKPGGGGGPFPGAAEVARAPADGSTIGSFVIGVPVVGHLIGMEELKEDTFEPVGIFLSYPFVIVAGENAPYGTMEELAAHAKSDNVALGHFGPPLIPTKVAFGLAKKMGFAFASDSVFDGIDCNVLDSGDVDVATTTIPQILPCLGRIKILAAVTEERIPLVADAPTVGELRPDLNISLWNGLFVKKGTPREVKEKLAASAEETMRSERVLQFAADTGTAVYWKGAEESELQIARDKRTDASLNALIEGTAE